MNVIVQNPTLVSDRGTDVSDWTTPVQTAEEWNLHPLPALEVKDSGRQAVVQRLNGIGPADTVLTAHSRMVVDGLTYEVDGSVLSWPSLSGGLAHSEAVLQRVAG